MAVVKFEVPATIDARRDEMKKQIETFMSEYAEFKEKNKKSCGSRAKKALTNVKKMIISVRRDIQEEINNCKKEEK
jgi:hypothetical protein